MTESKSMILGCAGKSLTREEINFYRNECPWAFILFARNIGETEQIRDLVAEMRDCIGRPDALVFIDQEGGRVQRLRPPLAPNYPAGGALGALWRDDHDA
ncbi:glycoside hydrolase family 3 protein, partial [Mesorhizobium sp. M7A.F.Ca.CA.002.15.1.1]